MAFEVLAPKAGDVLCSPGTTTIRWTPDGTDSTYDVYLEYPAGNYILLQSGVTGETYTWNLGMPAYDGKDTFRIVVNRIVNGQLVEQAFSDYFSIDSAAPTVVIASPAAGETLSGTVILDATAQDTVSGVVKVEFYYSYDNTGDWTLAGTAYSEPWKVAWDTTCVVPDGDYKIKAVAYDHCGHKAESAVRDVKIDNLPEHYVQVLIDDPLCIPHHKPEAEQIVDFKVCVNITDIQVFPAYKATKLLILGNVDIEVLYVANDVTQTVHTAHFNVPLKTFLKWDDVQGMGLDPCKVLEPVIVCEHVEYKLVNPRTIVKSIVLFIGIKAVDSSL